MENTFHARLIEAVARAVIEHAEELTALDQAIGDGDHGLNMKRGAEAVLAQRVALGAQPFPEALAAVGTTLVMKVGGASGPLYGTLLRTLGKELPPAPSREDLVRALGVAIDAVKKIGRSQVGQKTMLDVLAPVHGELARGGEGLGVRVREVAGQAAIATIPMRATKGRASFLGDRSIGHMDPGARSTALMVFVVCQVMEEQACPT